MEEANVLQKAISWFFENKETIIAGYFAIVGLASWVVKLTPTLKDDAILKGVIKFVGKYIAVSKYGPTSGAPKP